MFECVQSVFQHPDYNGELNQLYHWRKLKYTINIKEAAILFRLLDTGICENLFHYDVLYMEPGKKGYQQILQSIEARIARVHEHNEQILRHPLKRLFPRLFKQKVGKKVSVAYQFIKYHHYNYMALEYPDLAFNRSFGIEDLNKRFETYPKRFTATTNKKRTFKKFSASNLRSYLRSKRGWFFRHSIISNLYDEFDRKVDEINRDINSLHIMRNKKTIREKIKKDCKQKYTDLSGNPETPFIKRLASFLGITHSDKKPLRNLFIQEVKTKIEHGSYEIQERAKAMVSFTKGLSASNKASDYSVSEEFRGHKQRYKSFVLADTPENMPGDINAKKFMPKPNVTVH